MNFLSRRIPRFGFQTEEEYPVVSKADGVLRGQGEEHFSQVNVVFAALAKFREPAQLAIVWSRSKVGTP